MSTTARKHILTAVRIAVCAVALAWVLHGVTWHDHATLRDGRRLQLLELDSTAKTFKTVEPDGTTRTHAWAELAATETGEPQITYGLCTAWRESHKALLLLTLAVFAPVTPLQSLRFKFMFRAQGMEISYWECVKLCYAGNFLNFATPVGTTAGDVFKAYHVARHTPHKTEAVTTIMLDRIIGLGCLLALVGVTVEIGARDPYLRYLGHVIMASMVAAIVGAALFFSERVRERWLPTGLVARLPFEQQIRRVDAATRRLLQHISCFSGAILCTLALQFIAMCSFVLAAYALRMNFAESKVYDYYACIGTALVVAAVPISPQGLGTSEAVYRKFMLGSHGTLAQLLFMAMAVRLIQLVWALPGAIVALTGSYRLAPHAGTGEASAAPNPSPAGRGPG